MILDQNAGLVHSQTPILLPVILSLLTLAQESPRYGVRLLDVREMKADAFVTILGWNFITIRDKGSEIFDCPMERAQMIADRMNKAATKGTVMLFEVRKEGDKHAIYMIDHMGRNLHKTITVFPGDVEKYRAYGLKHLGERYKSFVRRLDSRLLALYWRDLATDIQAVFCDGEKPRWIVYTFCGKILDTIYERARRRVPEGVFPQRVLRDVLATLSTNEKMHLRMITEFVPFDYYPVSRVANETAPEKKKRTTDHR